MPSDRNELTRRRALLGRHIGAEVQLKRAVRHPDGVLHGATAVLREVQQSRVLLDFGDLGLRWFPLIAVLLPVPLKADPMPLELYA